jgi:hypothetical protein
MAALSASRFVCSAMPICSLLSERPRIAVAAPAVESATSRIASAVEAVRDVGRPVREIRMATRWIGGTGTTCTGDDGIATEAPGHHPQRLGPAG